jgi:hypothetical protein
MGELTMTEENNIWEYDNIEIDENGKVRGSAYTFTFNGGYDVQIVVSSYTYERNGEFHMNHVPNVVVSNKNGNIVAEPHARDSQHPEKAIENARMTAKNVYENPEQFI